MALYTDLDKNMGGTVLPDIKAVFQSIDNIFSTMKGERMFNPTFGLDTESLLWELMDDSVAFQLYTKLYVEINKVDPRIILLNSKSSIIADPAGHSYDITLVFEVAGLKDREFEYKGIVRIA